MLHLFASDNDSAPVMTFKIFIGWILVGTGYLLEHATQLAALAAFAWSCLNIYFLLRDRIKKKRKL